MKGAEKKNTVILEKIKTSIVLIYLAGLAIASSSEKNSASDC